MHGTSCRKLKTDEIKHTWLKSKVTKQKLLTELMQLKGDIKSSENYACIINPKMD